MFHVALFSVMTCITWRRGGVSRFIFGGGVVNSAGEKNSLVSDLFSAGSFSALSGFPQGFHRLSTVFYGSQLSLSLAFLSFLLADFGSFPQALLQ